MKTWYNDATTRFRTFRTVLERDSAIVRHLTPETLKAISDELEAAERNAKEDEFLDNVNAALAVLR